MRIYLGADHAGYKYKEMLMDSLHEHGHDPVDLGTFSEVSVDYPDFAREVAEKVYENKGSYGILICGSGTGMAMAANKHVGIRAAACSTEWLAEYARKHNDANVLCLGARVVAPEMATEIVKVFLSTAFEGGRHEARVAKINSLDGGVEGIHEIVVEHVKDVGKVEGK